MNSDLFAWFSVWSCLGLAILKSVIIAQCPLVSVRLYDYLAIGASMVGVMDAEIQGHPQHAKLWLVRMLKSDQNFSEVLKVK